MYALIMLPLVPFVLLGAIMALSSWEQRMLPSPEQTGADLDPSQPTGPQPTQAPAHRTSTASRPGTQEPAPVTARNTDHDRPDPSRPVGRGAARLDHGRPAARQDRSPDHPDPRRRPPGRARDAQRRPR